MVDTTTSKNASWNIGKVVKVGFLFLRVVGCTAVKDGKPDIYYLASLDGSKHYEFIPHNGLRRIN